MRLFSRGTHFSMSLLLLFIVNILYVSVVIGAPAEGKNGMVATAHPLATEAGLEMLKAGGNAIDAAVAAAFTIGVVEPDGSGLGGGGAMIVYLKNRNVPVYINYYHMASEDVSKINYNSKQDRHTVKSILIPGTVAGLLTALENFGTLPLATVMAPAIRHAKDGFPIDATLAGILLDNIATVTKDTATAKIYSDDGFPLMEDDILTQPDLAVTLEKIALEGRKGFYEGDVAETFVEKITSAGGVLTLSDLKEYKADISEPARGNYRGYDILSAGAPQSGITIIEALNILENFNLRKMGHYSKEGTTLHIMAETFKRVYADRYAYIQDTNFGEVPIYGLVSKAYASERFSDINQFKEEPRNNPDTRPGNPFKYNSPVSNNIFKKSTNDKSSSWGEDVDDERSSYNSWGESLFDDWGRPKNKSENKKMKVDTLSQKDMEQFQEYDGHTTHLSVIDKDGNAVSLTQTLGTFFGSGITIEGVLFNCGMSNYATTAAVNAVKPRKRPRSSISPTIVLKGDNPYMVVGSPGAGRIISTVIELIVNGIDYGMNVEQINDSPRFYCQKFDEFLHVEAGISKKAIKNVKRKGHKIKEYGEMDLFFGGAQLIFIDPLTGNYYGSADKRRGGIAAGY